jgi:hypothetical protein
MQEAARLLIEERLTVSDVGYQLELQTLAIAHEFLNSIQE